MTAKTDKKTNEATSWADADVSYNKIEASVDFHNFDDKPDFKGLLIEIQEHKNKQDKMEKHYVFELADGETVKIGAFWYIDSAFKRIENPLGRVYSIKALPFNSKKDKVRLFDFNVSQRIYRDIQTF